LKRIVQILHLLLVMCLFQCSQNNREVYLFSYFKGNGEDGLHLAYSYDGYKWIALKNDRSFLKPEAGQAKLMRDPCIIQGPDGLFHMVWTVSWREKGIGYVNSPDLINWSEQKYLPVMEHEPDAVNCWAPEIFYDEEKQQYLIFWSTTIPGRFPETDYQNNTGTKGQGHNHRIYYLTTKDLKEFSETQLFYDAGFNVIDATIIKADSHYIMFIKDETNKPFTPQKNIRMATSDRAEGPYGLTSSPITGEYWAEGPTVIKINDTWHLYFDKYRLKQYGLLISNDLKNWLDKSDDLDYPEDLRHGTVFKISEKLFQSLLSE
jgi:hypothetical protein